MCYTGAGVVLEDTWAQPPETIPYPSQDMGGTGGQSQGRQRKGLDGRR